MLNNLISIFQKNQHSLAMTNNFNPGEIVSQIQLKNDKQIIIRYPKWSDLTGLTKLMNQLSEEKIISYSGEVITREQEMNWLADIFVDMEKGNAVYLLAMHNDELIGNVSIINSNKNLRLTSHVANFGIAIQKDFRGFGLGFLASKIVIKEAEKKLKHIQQIQLNFIGTNTAGLKLYHKLGFKECGRIPKGFLFRGEYVDDVQMYLDLGELQL